MWRQHGYLVRIGPAYFLYTCATNPDLLYLESFDACSGYGFLGAFTRFFRAFINDFHVPNILNKNKKIQYVYPALKKRLSPIGVASYMYVNTRWIIKGVVVACCRFLFYYSFKSHLAGFWSTFVQYKLQTVVLYQFLNFCSILLYTYKINYRTPRVIFTYFLDFLLPTDIRENLCGIHSI